MNDGNQIAETELIGLIVEAKGGDETALNRLLEMLRPILRANARQELRGRVGGDVDPSDVVQETMLAVCRDLPGFEGETPGQFHAWVNRIAAHRLIDLIRKIEAGTRDVRLKQSLDAVNGDGMRMGDGLDGGTSTPSERAARDEQLERALANLPPDQRTAFTLRQLDGAKLDEIAAKLGLSADETALLLDRATRAMQRHLRKERDREAAD